jgi:hypothetical protein
MDPHTPAADACTCRFYISDNKQIQYDDTTTTRTAAV